MQCDARACNAQMALAQCCQYLSNNQARGGKESINSALSSREFQSKMATASPNELLYELVIINGIVAIFQTYPFTLQLYHDCREMIHNVTMALGFWVAEKCDLPLEDVLTVFVSLGVGLFPDDPESQTNFWTQYLQRRLVGSRTNNMSYQQSREDNEKATEYLDFFKGAVTVTLGETNGKTSASILVSTPVQRLRVQEIAQNMRDKVIHSFQQSKRILEDMQYWDIWEMEINEEVKVEP